MRGRGSGSGRGGGGGGGAAPSGGEAGRDGENGIRALLLAAGVLVAGQLALMIASFDLSPHTGGDNAGYLILAHSLLERGAYLDLWDPAEPLHSKYPPVFPFLLALAAGAGARTWVAFKAIPALSVTFAVLFSFLWARERRGLLFGLGVAGLLAVSDAVLYSSRWILSDPTFLAFTLLGLWAFERGGAGGTPAPGLDELLRRMTGAGPESGSGEGRGEGPNPTGDRGGLWLGVGCGAALLAFFTRSAGLPLVAAVLLWLGLRRRWRSLGAFGVAFALPALLWWIRGRWRGTEDPYLSEFWLVDPYQPELGRAGFADLVARVVENAQAYVVSHLPEGILGTSGPLVTLLGVALVGFAAAGWFRRIRKEAGVAELFLPLYAGLVLLWPQVWSGGRFALPLFPLLFFYGGEALLDLGRRVHSRGAGIAGGLALVALGAPALWAWGGDAREAPACAERIRAEGPYACYGPGVQEFVSAARWSGERLPDGAVVLSRKPRIFHLLSEVKSRTFPFTGDPSVLLARAREWEARYLLVDRWDGLAGHYLVPVVRERPAAFCSLGGFGEGRSGRTEFLGILGDDGEGRGGAAGEEVRIALCPDSFLREEPRSLPPYSSLEVPLFSSARE